MDRVGGEHTMIYQAPKDKFILGSVEVGLGWVFFSFWEEGRFLSSVHIYIFCQSTFVTWLGLWGGGGRLLPNCYFFFSEEVSLGSWFKHTIIKYNHTLPMHQSHNYLTFTTHQILRHSL